MSTRSKGTSWKPIEFHNRYAQVVLDRDVWSPYLNVVVKKAGVYRLTVFREGYRRPIVQVDLEIAANANRKAVRIAAGMTVEYLERLFVRLEPSPMQ